MRAKSFILLILALGCGLVASIGINQVLASRSQPVVKAGETEPICVALADVDMFDPVSPQAIKIEQWPKDKVPAGSIAKIEDAEGRRAKTKLFAGEPLLDSKLLPKGETGAGASQLVPKGYRTVGVKVDMDSGLAGLIKPGDRVDVLVFVQANPQMNVTETATHTVLQNVKVFAVDSTFRNEDGAEDAIQARTVSLVVTPEQAETVLLAAQLGKVQLSLRNANDEETASSSGTNTRAMLGGVNRDDQPADLPDFLSKGQEPKPTQEVKVETPAPTQVVDAGPQWKMTLYKGPDAVQYEFRDGQLPQIVGTLGNSQQNSGAAPATVTPPGIMSLPGFNPPPAETPSDQEESTPTEPPAFPPVEESTETASSDSSN